MPHRMNNKKANAETKEKKKKQWDYQSQSISKHMETTMNKGK